MDQGVAHELIAVAADVSQRARLGVDGRNKLALAVCID